MNCPAVRGDTGEGPFRLRLSTRAHWYKRSVSASDNLALRWISKYCGNGISWFLTTEATSARSLLCSFSEYRSHSDKFRRLRPARTSLSMSHEIGGT